MDKRFFITILLLISICFLIVTTTITFLTREKVANNIENARNGNCQVHAGGGGNYGKIEVKK